MTFPSGSGLASPTVSRPVTADDPGQPTLITSDPDLRSEVERAAAATGTRLLVGTSAQDLRQAWRFSPLVMVGADTSSEALEWGLRRRSGVYIVAAGRAGEPVGTSVLATALTLGAEEALLLPAHDARLMDLFNTLDTVHGPLCRTIAVVGATGGVGASVLAAALAQVSARERETVLVDLDASSVGARHLVGMDRERGIVWPDLLEVGGRVGVGELRDLLPRRDRLSVLGWAGLGPAFGSGSSPVDAAGFGAGDPEDDRHSGVQFDSVLASLAGGHRAMVIDLPRSASRAHGVPAWEGWGTVPVVLVARPDALSRLAAERLIAAWTQPRAGRPWGALAGVVIRGRPGPRAEELAESLGLPLLGALNDQRRLSEQLELGLGAVRSRAVVSLASRLWMLTEQAHP